MQILVPILGYSQFFPKDEFYFPKPLIEVAGKAMIEIVVQQLMSQFTNARFIFVIDQADARSFSLDRTLNLIAGDTARIVEKSGPTSGALCSCLLAVDELEDDEPLIIANSDQIINYNLGDCINAFKNQCCDAGVITFESIHPRWSYVVADSMNQVSQTFEKKVASRNAIAGFYYYKNASVFKSSAMQVINNDSQVDGKYYISSSLNEIILSGSTVNHIPIDSKNYHSFYAPSKVSEFERSTYCKQLREIYSRNKCVNIIIPAAGEGSRFASSGWKKPKPFIDVAGQMMLSKVIDNISAENSSITVLLRAEHITQNKNSVNLIQNSAHRVVSVPALTEGTASTILLARDFFDNNDPMIVANSDQLVDFDVNNFIQDAITRQLDGSILVFKDENLDPKWSFAKINDAGLVVEVAEKIAISHYATVGIYLFTKGSDFVESAFDMILDNNRVNGEFYTCPVYNYMIKKGAKIGIYEVPYSSMYGLGTPQDLEIYLESFNLDKSKDCPD